MNLGFLIQFLYRTLLVHKTGKTILMRVKEGSDDYRYFPEPDIVPLYVDEEWKERVRQTIPELPH
jgi:aspartyl-tRNA(Asn)/glutamyl-tRNA(Gln) amidotransferase subunit B